MGETRSTSIVSGPETSSSVPGVIAQLSLKIAGPGSSPSAPTTFRPGQSISCVKPSSQVLIRPHWASERTATLMMYGA
jgi:hypothetical protein